MLLITSQFKMFVGSFEPDDFDQFQADTVAAISAFQSAGVSRLLIDLTNNGGKSMFCLVEVLVFKFVSQGDLSVWGNFYSSILQAQILGIRKFL